MLNNLLAKVFGTSNERAVKRLLPTVTEINAFEPSIEQLTDEQFRAKTAEFRQRIADVGTQMFGLRGMAGDIDLRRGPVRGGEWGMQATALDAVILPLEIDLVLPRPERFTNRQELLGASISVVVIEEIAVPALLVRGAPRDDIYGHPPLDQSR